MGQYIASIVMLIVAQLIIVRENRSPMRFLFYLVYGIVVCLMYDRLLQSYTALTYLINAGMTVAGIWLLGKQIDAEALTAVVIVFRYVMSVFAISVAWTTIILYFELHKHFI